MPLSIVPLQAVDLVMSERLLEVEVVDSADKKQHIYVPYVLQSLKLNLVVILFLATTSSSLLWAPLQARMVSPDWRIASNSRPLQMLRLFGDVC